MSLPSNSLLDIIISLVLVYALLSILVSIFIEWWNFRSKARGTFLKDAIDNMLKDSLNRDYGALFYDHFMISGLRSDGKRPPQYISSNLFSEVLIDILANQSLHKQRVKLTGIDAEKGKQYELVGDPLPLDLKQRITQALKQMNGSPFKDGMESFWLKAEGDTDKFKQLIEAWFNDHMDRVSGWYKIKQRNKLIFFGFVVAIGLNVDSLHMVKILSMDSALRERLVAVSEKVADQYEAMPSDKKNDTEALWKILEKSVPDSLKANVKQELAKLPKNSPLDSAGFYSSKADSVLGIAASLNVPIGWNKNSAPLSWFNKSNHCKVPSHRGILAYNNHRNHCYTFGNIFMYLIGIIISGFSLSFGAPFWFDLLVKFVNIRRAGKKPEVVSK
ncbi:MAG: hypothetical protein ACKVOQ_12370 [Cyclobacteriaceae bacterium]